MDLVRSVLVVAALMAASTSYAQEQEPADDASGDSFVRSAKYSLYLWG